MEVKKIEKTTTLTFERTPDRYTCEGLSARLKEIRKTHTNLSQTELGKLLDVHYRTVFLYENSRMPPIDYVLKFANLFDLSLDELFAKETG